MERNAAGIGVAVISVLALLVGFGGWQLFQHHRELACDACARPLHSHAHVAGLAGGEQKQYCCPACALADQRQTGQPVDIIGLTDYHSNESLAPESAFVVIGSRVNHCLRSENLVNERKQVSSLEFDRCSPSVLAFASELSARDFMSRNGGRLTTFAEIQHDFE